MATLIKETKVYEVDTAEQAFALIAEKEKESKGDFSFSRKSKSKTKEGEVIAEWFEVKIEESFDDLKKIKQF